jgi:hypothetical protein
MRWLLLLIVCVVSSVAYSEQPQATQLKKASQAEKIGTDNEPFFVKIVPAQDAEEKAAKEEEHRKEKAQEDKRLADATVWLAAVTTILALFTALLWWATYKLSRDAKQTADRQAKEMQESLSIAKESADTAWQSVDLARQEFITTHRPKIIVRRVSIDMAKGVGIPDVLAAEFIFANIGNTKAILVEMSAKFWLPNGTVNLPPIPPYGDREYPGITLDSGESFPFKHLSTANVTNEYNFRLGHAQETLAQGYPTDFPPLLFIGYIIYEDGLKRQRRTAFLRSYDFSTKRFSPIDDPDYEYQD